MGESVRYTLKRLQVWSHAGLLAGFITMLWIARLRAQVECPGCSIEHRITSIETRLDSIEWVGKSIATLLAAQLVVLLFKNVGRRHETRNFRDR
jgi:hypothetical protein